MSDWRRTVEFVLRASDPFPEASDPVLPDGPDLDWGFVLDSVFRHRVAALVGRRLAQSGAVESESRREYVADALLAARLLNERRNRVLVAEAVRLCALLRAEGVRAAVRKGAYLAPVVYGDPGLRPMNDVDLFVDRSSASRAAALLEAEGYATGTIDAHGRLVPLTRRQSVYYVHVNNLPTYHRLASDPALPAVSVDVCFGLFLPATGCDLPAGDLFGEARTVRLGGDEIEVFRPEHFLIDVAAHLHKESTTLHYIERGKHQRLLQYVDIVAVVRSHPDLDWEFLTRAAAAASASRNVYFALAHTERLFPGTVPPRVVERLAADGGADETFLREYGAVDLRSPRTWSASDVVERLFTDEQPPTDPRVSA